MLGYGTFALYCYICRLNLLKGFNFNVDTLNSCIRQRKVIRKSRDFFSSSPKKIYIRSNHTKRIWKFDALPLPTDKLCERIKTISIPFLLSTFTSPRLDSSHHSRLTFVCARIAQRFFNPAKPHKNFLFST